MNGETFGTHAMGAFALFAATFSGCAAARDDEPVDSGDAEDCTDCADDSREEASDVPDDALTPSCSQPLDVVFVLDVSTSMEEEAVALRDGIDSIWSSALELSSDVRFGLVVFVDDALAVDDCRSFDSLPALRDEFDAWRAFCSSEREPGGAPGLNVDCAENSLDALWLAATACPWRDEATHIVVHVTDDTFAERPSVLAYDPWSGDGVPVERTYAPGASTTSATARST